MDEDLEIASNCRSTRNHPRVTDILIGYPRVVEDIPL